MPRVHLFDLVADLKGLNQFRKQVQNPSPGNPINQGLEAGANIYLSWLKQRYLNQGNGSWSANRPATIKRKQRIGANEDVLFEFGHLFEALTKWQIGNRWFVGYKEGIQHESIEGYGFAGTVARLAEIHAEGAYFSWQGKPGRPRRIVVQPTSGIRQQIIREARKGITIAVRMANSGR